MPSIKLTQLSVDAKAPPKTGRVEYFDTLLPGFALRIAASGHKAWVLFYRVAGKQRRYTIGTLATYPKVDAARERAREILRDVERGLDPAAVKAHEPASEASRPLEPDTVNAVATHFIERYCKPRNRSWKNTEALLKNHVLPMWGDRDV